MESTAPDGYSADAIKVFKSLRLGAYPAGGGVTNLRDAYDSSLQLLLAITGLVLLIACANLANLMLARASARQREMAIRMALGASRARLLRQLLIGSSLLAISGAAIGVLMAQPLSRLLVAALSTSDNTIQLSIVTDWRVLLFAAGVAVLTCVVFGTFPAMRGTSVDPIDSLKSGERGVAGNRERFSAQRLLVVTQIAVSLVLLVGAALFVRSYRNLMNLDPGFRESGLTVGYFGYPMEKIKPENEAAFKRQLVEDVRSVPGVQNAAATTNVLLNGGTWSHGVRVGRAEGSSRFTYVSPSYFATMGIPSLTGRRFAATDRADTPYVLIVNQAFVRKYLGAMPALGQLVQVMPEPQYPARTYQVVGTVVDTKYNDLRKDAEPMAFVPIDQFPETAQGPGVAMMIASSDGVAAIAAIRRTMAAKHPDMILQFHDFQQRHSRQSGGRAHDGDVIRILRRAGRSAGCDRTLRRAVVFHRAAPERDWHSHRARGAPVAGDRTGDARYCVDASDRCDLWNGTRADRRAGGDDDAVRVEALRRCDPGFCDPAAGGDRCAGELAAGAEGVEIESGRFPAVRVIFGSHRRVGLVCRTTRRHQLGWLGSAWKTMPSSSPMEMTRFLRIPSCTTGPVAVWLLPVASLNVTLTGPEPISLGG